MGVKIELFLGAEEVFEIVQKIVESFDVGGRAGLLALHRGVPYVGFIWLQFAQISPSIASICFHILWKMYLRLEPHLFFFNE